MELENQVCSLELSKKLKELGFKQESYFMWDIAPSGVKIMKSCLGTLKNHIDIEDSAVYSAYTVAELGEILPKEIKGREREEYERGFEYSHYTQGWHHKKKVWQVWYKNFDNNPRIPINSDSAEAKTEANARAEMLIYLKENKLNIKVYE